MTNDQSPYGLIYAIVNKVNGKRYIGQTTSTLKTRKQNHLDRDYGYNLKEGGANGKHSPEARKRISDSKIGIPLSEDHKQKLSDFKKGHWTGSKNPKHGKGDDVKGSSNPMFGKTHTEETRQKMSIALQGRKGYPVVSNPMFGKLPATAMSVTILKNGNIIGEFESATQAAKFLGISQPRISRIIRGERKPLPGIEIRHARMA